MTREADAAPIALRDRAHIAGITPGMLGAIMDRAPQTVSAILTRDAREALVVIAAWEIMTPEQRAAWLAALGVSAERPRRGRPRKLP